MAPTYFLNRMTFIQENLSWSPAHPLTPAQTQIQRAKYLGVVILCFNLGSWGPLVACNSGSPVLCHFNHFCRSLLLCVWPLPPAVWDDFLKNKSSAKLLTGFNFSGGEREKGFGLGWQEPLFLKRWDSFFLKNNQSVFFLIKKINNSTPLVAQCKRIHWPMQKRWVWSLGRVDPTCN